MAHHMAWSFRSNHKNIDIFTRKNLVEVDIETVSESNGGAFFKIRGDFFTIHVALDLVRQKYHQHIGYLGSLNHSNNLKTGVLGLFDRAGFFFQTDKNLNT